MQHFLSFAENLASFSLPHSLHHHSNHMAAQTAADKSGLDLPRDRFPFSAFEHHHARTPLPLTTKAVRRDMLANQCWNQQGITATWNQFQSEDKYFFSHQSWQLNPHC